MKRPFKTRKLWLQIALICAILTSTSPSFSQNGPSYEDTISFIFQKTNVQQGQYHRAFNEVSRCELSYVTTTTNNSGKTIRKFLQTVDLENLDPSRINSNVQSGGINFFTRENIASVRHDGVIYANSFDFQDSVTHQESIGLECNSQQCFYLPTFHDVLSLMTFEAENNVPRVERAMSHLIDLCGGQEELF